MKVPGQIRKIFEEGQSFLLTSHENPDADALGSMLALSNLLVSLGKSVFLYNPSGVPSFLKFLPGSSKIRETLEKTPETGFDALVVLDCPAVSRAGEDFEKYAASRGSPVVIVDHHKEMCGTGAVKWVETEAPATGTLVYQIFKSFTAPVSRESATCIYAAISGDTGSFRFANTTAECFSIASEMVSYGADPQEVSSAVYENQSLKRLKLLTLVLQSLKTDKTGRVAWVRIDRDMFDSTGTSKEDTEGMVDFPMSIKGVKVAMLFRQETARGSMFWKASIRSRGEIDVCEVANRFGGGGHKNAAGFTFDCDFEYAVDKVVNAVGGSPGAGAGENV